MGEHVIHIHRLGGYEYYFTLPPALLGGSSDSWSGRETKISYALTQTSFSMVLSFYRQRNPKPKSQNRQDSDHGNVQFFRRKNLMDFAVYNLKEVKNGRDWKKDMGYRGRFYSSG